MGILGLTEAFTVGCKGDRQVGVLTDRTFVFHHVDILLARIAKSSTEREKRGAAVGDLPLVYEKLEHFMLPQLQEQLYGDRRQGGEAPIWRKRPVGDYGMDMSVSMGEFIESSRMRF